MEEFIRYLHFIGIILLSGALVGEHLLLKRRIDAAQLRRLAVLDALFGASAAVVLIGGLGQWFWGLQPASFYSSNWVFHLKVTLFVVMALLSIYPTVFFIRNRKHPPGEVAIPGVIIHLIRAELALLLIIPLLAVLMARGIGL
jgi:putative membrane protein